MDIEKIRQEYKKNCLRRKDMHTDPMQQVKQWFQEAQTPEQPYANSISLATVNAEGIPSIRTVLLKGIDDQGFTFFTNYSSNKATDIESNPNVAIMCFWPLFERQVIIKGVAEKTTPAESAKYFATRPVDSQLGAWASHQSQVITNRNTLEVNFDRLQQKYLHKDIPCPDFWGGYHITAKTIEFWQGRACRLHDRFLYRKNHASEGWIIERLSP